LQDIDRAIEEKRQLRIREIRQKLFETAVLPARQPDLEVVRSTLDRGGFLSADEYIELIRKAKFRT